MIKVFSSTDKNFTSNGDIVVNPLKARVYKADNGDYYLNLETSLDYVDYIVQGNIVVANTPTGDQAFRIGNVTKTKNKLSTKAYHVFYDSKNYLISDSYVVEKTCAEALAHLNSATEPQSEFETFSDINTIESYRCVRTSLYGAIMTVLERWKGHLVRDNFRIGIAQTIGQDNGVVVQYRKNLKEITCAEDWSDVITKILPVGKDGILLNELDPSADIYITSETQYSIPYTKTVSFQQDINEEDYPSEAEYKQALVDDLRRQANVYLSANCIPKVNYTLKANLEKITDVGDIVEVIDEKLGIDLMSKVISFEYDCIAEKYTQVEFGNFTKSLSNLISTIVGQTERAINMAGGGSVVSYTQILSSGTQTGQITIDGLSVSMYAPTPPTKTSELDNDSGFITGVDIDDIGDVSLNNLLNGQILKYNSTSQKWENADESGGGGSYSEGDGIDISAQNEISVDTTFTEASERTNINSGDLLSIIFGKIKKWFTDIPSLFVNKSGDTMTGDLTLSKQGTIFKIRAGGSRYTNITSSASGADSSIVLPNASGTVALTSNIPDISGKVDQTGNTTLSGTFAPSSDRGVSLGTSSARFYYCYFYRIMGLASIANDTAGSNRLNLPSKSGTLAVTTDIPTDTNQLTNGAGFISSAGGSINANASLYFGSSTRISDLNSNRSMCLMSVDGVASRQFSNANAFNAMYASAFSVQSSKLTKENIKPVSDNEAEKLLSINVVGFDYIKECGGNKNQVGMIAEEILDIYPNLVQIPNNYDEEETREKIKNGDFAQTLSIDYSKFVPYLIKMVQMQQKEIDELKNQIKELKK